MRAKKDPPINKPFSITLLTKNVPMSKNTAAYSNCFEWPDERVASAVFLWNAVMLQCQSHIVHPFLAARHITLHAVPMQSVYLDIVSMFTNLCDVT